MSAPPPPAGEGVRTSVVVAHYEQPAELARTLTALAAQTRRPDEVVVADDGSADLPLVPADVAAVLDVRVVTQEDHGFRAAAVRNLGAAATTGGPADVVCFLDADTVPEPDYLEHLVRGPATRPETVVVGRRRHVDPATGTELPEPAWLREAYARTRDLRDADETSYRFVISSVLGCTRWLLERLGGFDETLTAYGGEDWEWAHRAWTHGAVLAHEPLAVAWHDGPDRGGRPGWDAHLLDETLAVARRIPVPGAAPAGLLLGPPDPLVTVDPTVSGDALVLTLDSLLAALPRAAVLLGEPQHALLAGDPRLHPLGAAARLDRSAWRHLHVHRPVTGPASAWLAGAAAVAGPGAPGWVDVGAGATPVLTWSTLRAERRTAWGTVPAAPRTTASLDGLVVVPPTLSTQARWGGWA